MTWYSPVDATEIQQGDIVLNFPIVSLPGEVVEGAEYDLQPTLYNVIVVSQSCDLVNQKLDFVLVSQIYTIEEFKSVNPFFNQYEDQKLEALRQNFWPGFHLLNKCTYGPYDDQYLIADFRNVFSVPFDSLLKHVENADDRLRLQSPYRERLSQAFGLFVMRVALPNDIQKFCNDIFVSESKS